MEPQNPNAPGNRGDPAVEKDRTGMQPSDRPDFEGAYVLLDEWKFRRGHSRTSLQQYAIAAVTVSIIRYVKTDLIPNLDRRVEGTAPHRPVEERRAGRCLCA